MTRRIVSAAGLLFGIPFLAWILAVERAPADEAPAAAAGAAAPAGEAPKDAPATAGAPATASHPSAVAPAGQSGALRPPLGDAAEVAPAPKPVAPVKKPLSKDPPGMTRLSPEYDVWIDPKKKRVVMDGTVCLRQGTLEMFACLKGTKEHESVVFVDTKAFIVHAGLLAVGAKPGSPARFQPEYRPASGTPIDITLVWTDEKGAVKRDRAQQWVRDFHTQKALDSTWVFAGSGIWTDETTGQKNYLAEGGDFICVSNFPGAMLDLPVESSQANQELLFEAFTEHIPPRGTRVRIVLTPRLENGDAEK